MSTKNLSKQRKGSKGITLIALVVTIIVLLILAGVTVGNLTKDNGIIKEAKKAKEQTEIKSLEEQIDLVLIQVEKENRNPTINNVIQKLIENGIIENETAVNKETGDITTKNPSYIISGKLEDYIIDRVAVWDAICLIETAEGALNETHDFLQRMYELEVSSYQYASEPLALENLQCEMNGLIVEINEIAEGTIFDGTKILNGTLAGNSGYRVKVGGTYVTVSICDVSARSLGVDVINILTENEQELEKIQNAISIVSDQRRSLGDLHAMLYEKLEE